MRHLKRTYLEESSLSENLTPDFPNYHITTNGEIYKRAKYGWFRLKVTMVPRHGKWIYHSIGVWNKDGKLIHTFIHRLVLMAYVGKSDLQCRHLDGNPENNNLSNLCYGTSKENCQDRDNHGTTAAGERCGMAELKSEDIPVIFSLYSQNFSQPQIATKFNVSTSTISRVLKRKTWESVKIDETLMEEVFRKLAGDQNRREKYFPTKEELIEIFQMHQMGMSMEQIEDKKKISRNLICRILKREVFSNIILPSEATEIRLSSNGEISRTRETLQEFKDRTSSVKPKKVSIIKRVSSKDVELFLEYRKNGLSHTKISELTGFNRSTIFEHLKKHFC